MARGTLSSRKKAIKLVPVLRGEGSGSALPSRTPALRTHCTRQSRSRQAAHPQQRWPPPPEVTPPSNKMAARYHREQRGGGPERPVQAGGGGGRHFDRRRRAGRRRRRAGGAATGVLRCAATACAGAGATAGCHGRVGRGGDGSGQASAGGWGRQGAAGMALRWATVVGGTAAGGGTVGGTAAGDGTVGDAVTGGAGLGGAAAGDGCPDPPGVATPSLGCSLGTRSRGDTEGVGVGQVRSALLTPAVSSLPRGEPWARCPPASEGLRNTSVIAP